MTVAHGTEKQQQTGHKKSRRRTSKDHIQWVWMELCRFGTKVNSGEVAEKRRKKNETGYKKW